MSDVDQRFVALCEKSVEDAKRIAKLEAALRGLLSACERYDEDPESIINQANYLDAKIEAKVFLDEISSSLKERLACTDGVNAVYA